MSPLTQQDKNGLSQSISTIEARATEAIALLHAGDAVGAAAKLADLQTLLSTFTPRLKTALKRA
jgi:hypothetical protein